MITPEWNLNYIKLREDINLDIRNEEYLVIIKRNKLYKKIRKLITQRNKNIINKKRATIPQRPGFYFVYNTQSKIDIITQNNNNDKNIRKNIKYINVEAKFKKLKQNKINNQAYKPSVTGRRV